MNRSTISEVTERWVDNLGEFLPGFLSGHPVLSKVHDRASLILHGSTTIGIDDHVSDLDLWMLLPQEKLEELDSISDTRFFEIKTHGKEGHINALATGDFRKTVVDCGMETIYELQTAVLLTDGTAQARSIIDLARKPMRTEVSRAFFFHHYVKMRERHRACDNPIERSDAVGVLVGLPGTLCQAMRAAIVLDLEPYPYDKWLYHKLVRTRTGRKIAPRIDSIIDHLAGDALRKEGPESENPLSLEIRKIRADLVEAAGARGIDEPWLVKWWLHMDRAWDVVKHITWQ